MENEKPSGSVAHLWVALALLAALIVLWWLGLGPGGNNTCCHQAHVRTAVAVTSKPIQQLKVASALPNPANAPATAPATAPEPAAPILPPAVTPAAPIVAPAAPNPPVPSVTKLYFKVNDPNLREDARELIAPALSFLQTHAGAKVRLQGFHDPVGDLAHNQALANSRAENVKALLVGSGVDAARIAIDQPSDMTGGGARPKARRVEVTVTP